jgi:outer membrane receptor protein involved in Fe transport
MMLAVVVAALPRWVQDCSAQDWSPFEASFQQELGQDLVTLQDPLQDPLARIEQPAAFATQPPAPTSLLLERLNEIAGPSATGFLVAEQPLEIETSELARNVRTASGGSRVRRSQVSMQPSIRGYQQQSVFSQYQGAQFIPVRFDLDSVLTSIDPGILDNLVVIPGPYGVRYGPGLAFFDLEAAPLPRNEIFGWESRTDVLYRSNGGQFYGRETVTAGGPTYGTRASYGHKVGSDYFTGDNRRIPGSYNVVDANVAAAFDLTPEASLQFEYLFQGMSDTEFAGLAFDAQIRQTDAFFGRYAYEDEFTGSSCYVEGWYNRTFFNGDNLNDSKQNFYQANPVFVPPGSFIGVTDADITSSGCRLSLSNGNVDAGKFTVGTDFRYFEGELNEFDDFGAIGEFESFPIPRARMADWGIFAEFFVPILVESELKFGARFDRVSTRQDAVYSSVDPAGVEHVFDYGEDFVAYNSLYHGFVTTDHPLTRELKLRAGFGHGQRPPNLTERFAEDPFLTLVQNSTSAVIGDVELNPERASQFDLALHGDYGDMRFQVSVFWSYVDEHITLAPGIDVPPDPDLRLLDFVNNDSVLDGGEVFAEVDVVPSLTVFGKLSYVEGRNLVMKQPLPNIYPLQGQFGVLWYEPVENRYGVEFVGWVVDDQNRLATSLFEQATPGFAKFDLRGYRQVTDAIRVTVAFENLGDREYLEHLSVHNPRVSEPGFSFYLATQINL